MTRRWCGKKQGMWPREGASVWKKGRQIMRMGDSENKCQSKEKVIESFIELFLFPIIRPGVWRLGKLSGGLGTYRSRTVSTDLWECWKSQEERNAWPAQPEILKQKTPKPGERAVNMLDRPFERWLGGRRKLAFKSSVILCLVLYLPVYCNRTKLPDETREGLYIAWFVCKRKWI